MGEAGQALPLGAVAVPGEVSLAIGAGQILVQIAGQNLGAQQTAAGRRLDGQMAVVVYGPLMGAAVDFPVREAAVAAQADAAGADAAQRKHDFPGAGAGIHAARVDVVRGHAYHASFPSAGVQGLSVYVHVIARKAGSVNLSDGEKRKKAPAASGRGKGCRQRGNRQRVKRRKPGGSAAERRPGCRPWSDAVRRWDGRCRPCWGRRAGDRRNSSSRPRPGGSPRRRPRPDNRP